MFTEASCNNQGSADGKDHGTNTAPGKYCGAIGLGSNINNNNNNDDDCDEDDNNDMMIITTIIATT